MQLGTPLEHFCMIGRPVSSSDLEQDCRSVVSALASCQSSSVAIA